MNDSKLSFKKVFGKVNRINAVAGFRYTSNDSEQDYAEGYNSGTDELKAIITLASIL